MPASLHDRGCRTRHGRWRLHETAASLSGSTEVLYVSVPVVASTWYGGTAASCRPSHRMQRLPRVDGYKAACVLRCRSQSLNHLTQRKSPV